MLEPPEHPFAKAKVLPQSFCPDPQIISAILQICVGCVNGHMNPRLSAH